MTPGTLTYVHSAATCISGTLVFARHYAKAGCRRADGHAADLHPCPNAAYLQLAPRRTRALRQQTRRATSAVAAVDQEPLPPATHARPTAQQIFDLYHVPHFSPSLVLYFPIGELCLHSL